MALDTDNNLITLAEAKTWCSIKTATTDYDDVIEDFIDGVSWAFNEYTRLKLKARDITVTMNGDGTNRIFLADYPINSVSALYLDSDHEFGSDTEVSSDDYQIRDLDGLIFLEADVAPNGVNTVKIEYNGGYSTIPPDIVLACLDEVKRRFFRWKANAENVDAINVGAQGDKALIPFDQFLTTSKSVLDKYRRWAH